jgi:hypothetical protein
MAGISGDPELQGQFLKQLRQLRSILEEQYKFERDHIFVLFEEVEKDPAVIQYKSTRENVQKLSLEISRRARKEDLVFVFIAGHGSSDGKVYKLNLVGPDPTAEELADMLYAIPARNFIVVNTTTCSGGSVGALSKPGKVVVTATKSGHEKNQTHMGEFFVDALEKNNADLDKSGRVSILEAFNYAVQRVSDYYTKEGNLQTEHPVLDDNGDSKAHDKPAPDNGDGFLARTTYLDAGPALLASGRLTPAEKGLALEAQDLEKQIEALKYDKQNLPEAEYERKLEALLLKLAQINATLRKK